MKFKRWMIRLLDMHGIRHRARTTLLLKQLDSMCIGELPWRLKDLKTNITPITEVPMELLNSVSMKMTLKMLELKALDTTYFGRVKPGVCLKAVYDTSHYPNLRLFPHENIQNIEN